MKEKQIQRLKRIIEKGKKHFVLYYGVLAWGLTTGIVFSIFQHVVGNVQTFKTILVHAVIFSVGGVFWGLFLWRYINKQYQKVLPKA